MGNLPKDCSARVIGAEARKIVHYVFPSEHWEYHELTGRDNGLDCIIELVENDEWSNKKIEGQIKGTQTPKLLKTGKEFSLEIKVKTILYGLSSSSAFVIFFVDVEKEVVYYLPIQDYFISRPELFDKVEGNSTSLNVHIPCDNTVSDNDYELMQIAKSVYVGGPSIGLRKA